MSTAVRRRVLRPLSLLVSTVVGLGLAVTVAAPARADVALSVSIFYAAPTGDGGVDVGGLFHGSPNTAYDGTGDFPQIGIDAQGSCNDEGSQVTSFAVTTDGNGDAYFAQHLLEVGGALVPHTTNYSVFGNCYPIGPDNTAWSKAQLIPLTSGIGSAQGVIAAVGESRWYKVHVTPDSTLTVTLSGLAADDALAVYSDIGQAANASASSTTSLNKLSAEFAADTFSPSAFTPSAFTPSAFTPSAFTPSAFTPSAFTPSAFTPSAFTPSAFTPSSYSPSAFTPSAFTPSAFTPSAFTPSAFTPSAFTPSAFTSAGFTPAPFLPSSYSGAVSRSLLGYNGDGGTADKSVTVNTWKATGDFYVSVAERDGNAQPDSPFTVTVNDGSGSCDPSVHQIGSAPAAAPAAGVRTVIVTDSSRVPGGAAEKSLMLSQLGAVAGRSEVAGTVVDLSSNARVQQLQTQAAANTNCPYAANLVAGAIRDVVDSYRAHNPLAYVTIAGGDAVVPFFRHPDQTLIGNETGYTPPVADSSPAQAALRLGYALSDNDYGAAVTLSTKADDYPVPDVAVGRLVESAAEISGQLTAYLGTSGGVLPTPTTSLVTGYDFLTLAANAVKSDLDAGIGKVGDTLIAPREQAPSDPASWTGSDLRTKVLNSGRHDIVFLAGHFSANDALAADYTTDMITTDMEHSSVDLTNSLVFSAGCHSGYGIPDSQAVPGVTLTLDWPQEFARKRAIFIGGTGYQYGDTDFVAYSEQVDANFAHNLRLGTGPVAIGQALLKAKQDYLSSLPNPSAIQQKSVLEAELYGLPMASINLPTGRISAPSDPSVVGSTTPAASDPGSSLGLSSATVTVSPQLTEHSVTLHDLTRPSGTNAVAASYLSGSAGVVTNPYQPVLPLESRNVSVPGKAVRGVLFLGGDYHDTSGVTPLTGAPTTEIRGVHTAFTSATLFPQQLWSVNRFGALDGGATDVTRLLVTPAQHRSDAGGTNTRRRFGPMTFQVYYSGNTQTYGGGSTPALTSPPSISTVYTQLDASGTGIDVCTDIGGDPAAGIQDALVTSTRAGQADGSWTSQHLTLGGCDGGFFDPTGWGATIPLNGADASSVRFLVQAVNGVGLTSLDDNLGAYYSLTQRSQFGQTILHDVTVSSSSVPTGGSVTMRATLNQSNGNPPPEGIFDPIPGATVTFAVGSVTATAVTDSSGQATATLDLPLAPGTYTSSVGYNPTDGTAPTSAPGTPVTVTRLATSLDLSRTASAPAGDSGYTATLCATTAPTCGPDDPPVANRTVLFTLTGPAPQTVAELTDASGRARFDAYGLPAGGYTLHASGPLTGAASPDPLYSPSSASVDFSAATPSAVPPTLTVPVSVTVPAAGAQGAVVSYAVSATDPVDPRPAISCSTPSVSLFPVGTTTVSCTATDTAGNSATRAFPVTVQPVSTGPIKLSPGTTTCNGSYNGKGAAVVVPAGATCQLLTGTKVTGSITVQPGGSLNLNHVKVGGDVLATGANGVTICGSAITGAVTVTGSADGAVTTLGAPAAGCAPDTVHGDVAVTGNSGAVTVTADHLGHDLTVTGNTGAVAVNNDAVVNNATVTGNGGAVTVGRTLVGNDLTVSTNTGAVGVRKNLIGHDLTVADNTPGGATVIGNVAVRNATCSGNSPQAGKGNSGQGTVTCPR